MKRYNYFLFITNDSDKTLDNFDKQITTRTKPKWHSQSSLVSLNLHFCNGLHVVMTEICSELPQRAWQLRYQRQQSLLFSKTFLLRYIDWFSKQVAVLVLYLWTHDLKLRFNWIAHFTTGRHVKKDWHWQPAHVCLQEVF